MKIVYIIDGRGGGASTIVLELASGLMKMGVDTEVLFFSMGSSVAEAKKRGIAIHYIPKKKGRMLLFIWQLWQYVRKNNIDIIHSHTINGNFFARVAGKFSGIPVITTVHSYIIDEMKGLKKPSFGDLIKYELDIFMHRWVVALVTVSQGIAERVMNRGISPDKVEVIPNGINLEYFRPAMETGLNLANEFGISGEDRIVAIIARLVPIKDHWSFLSAAKEVLKVTDKVKFLIIGDGPLRGELELFAKQLGIDKSTIFAGWRSDVDKILPLLDVVALSSHMEGHVIAFLEAMACGKPVVGTDVQGISETITSGENGLLVPINDPTAMAEAIKSLIFYPDKMAEMGNRARKYVEENYSIQTMLESYLKLYQTV